MEVFTVCSWLSLSLSCFLIISVIKADVCENELNLTECVDSSIFVEKWKKLNTMHCGKKDGTTLHCQKDHNQNQICSTCARISKCGAGTYAQLGKGTVQCIQCSGGMYQPGGKESHLFTQPNCDRRHESCNPPSKILCDPGSDKTDNTCQCNYTNGYKPDKETCNCFAFDSDCNCITASCPEGQLNASYHCVRLTTSTTSISISSSTPASVSVTENRSDSNPGMIIAIVIGVIILIILIILFILWRRKFFQRFAIFRKTKCCRRACMDKESSNENGTTENEPLSGSPESSVPLPPIPNGTAAGPTAPPPETPADTPVDTPAEINNASPTEAQPLFRETSQCQASSDDTPELVLPYSNSDTLRETAQRAVIEQKLKEKLYNTKQQQQPAGTTNIYTAENIIIGPHGTQTVVNEPLPKHDSTLDVDGDDLESDSLLSSRIRQDGGEEDESDLEQTKLKRVSTSSTC